jgi:penicillin-binding protein 1A
LVTALEQGHSSGEVFTSAPQQIPFRAKVPKKHGKGTKVVNDVFRVNNYNDSYLGSASITTATTYSDNSVYSQLCSQVGPANVAQTAHDMGIETDLSTDTEYSINGGKFAPYNPALILGGLTTGVTPLEMAHAYETLAHNGQRVSGSMSPDPDGPVAISKVVDDGGDLVPTNTGASGQNETDTKQVVPPAVDQTAISILRTVVDQGTGTRANTGDDIWGKTGTTENNGDAWFVGSTKDVTIAVWVGHADSTKPMETEFGGGPVDGGTIPALIFNDVLTAFDQISAERAANEKPSTTAPTATVPTTTVPATTTTTAAPAPQSDQSSPSPTPDTGGGSGSGGTGGTGGGVGAG